MAHVICYTLLWSAAGLSQFAVLRAYVDYPDTRSQRCLMLCLCVLAWPLVGVWACHDWID